MQFQTLEPRIWETQLPDRTTLIGVAGDGSHTHIGPDFISIKDEQTQQHIQWNVPMNDAQRDFYGTGNNNCPY